ncbi:MAG: RING-H2 finger protein [Phycisphaerales bacterium]
MIQTATANRKFHLLDTEPAGGGETRVLPVPEGISRLVMGGDDTTPRLLPALGPDAVGGVVLEPITRHREMLLLVASEPGKPIRVNGATVGRLAAVREMDVIQVGHGGRRFDVAVHVHSVIGRAPERLAGETCAICHCPIEDAVVYLCSICGHAVHHDTGDGPNAKDCLLSNNCPSCQSAVLTEGYTALPEGL